MNCSIVEYPALVYKNNNNNVFIANCIIKNLIGYGQTEKDALVNLEKVLKKVSSEYPIKVKPVYRYLSKLS